MSKKKKEEIKNQMSLRDIAIIAISIGLFVLFIMNHRIFSFKPDQEDLSSQSGAENIAQQGIENPVVDTADWRTYRSQWYGFELKYPDNWEKPILRRAVSGSQWEYQYRFRKKVGGDSGSYAGFNVTVYDVIKVKELAETGEFPVIKNQELAGEGLCENIQGHLMGNENYPAEELYIPPTDDCYNSAFFYSLIRDEYIYNIIPVLKENQEVPVDSKKDTVSNFPEFFSVASHFYLIDIKRPKPQAVTPKKIAPLPVAAINVNGRLVCSKKNDHPGYSHKNKGKHLDMECCLDPDEYPNPHCTYLKDKNAFLGGLHNSYATYTKYVDSFIEYIQDLTSSNP